MSRINVEILTPGNGKAYEFKLDNSALVAEIAMQLSEMIEIFEAGNFSLDKKLPLLCSVDTKRLLNPAHSLLEAEIKNGGRLFLL